MNENSIHLIDGNKTEQRTIIILGMHRSGTSMLTGSLQEAGLVLGEVVTENPDNNKGNREHQAVMQMHNHLLKVNGGSWDNPPFPVVWQRLHTTIRDLFISNFRYNEIWGFKDPRTLITLDGWLKVLPKAELVGIFRDPVKVALSLKERNQMSVEKGLKLWLIYNKRLIEIYQKSSFPIIEFHDNSDLLKKSLVRLVSVLNLPYSSKELTFYNRKLQSKKSETVVLPNEIQTVYNFLKSISF